MNKSINTKKGILRAILFIVVSIIVTSCGNTQKPTDTKKIAEEHNDAKFSNTDKERDAQFLVNAAEINLEEISLGKLAQQIGNTADVKELGKMMEAEHTKSLNELTVLAKEKLITLPTSHTDEAQDAYKKLNDKSGSDFDKAYCDMMVSEHKDAISLYEKVTTKSTDEDIKAWANRTLQPLRVHLDNALLCQENCKKMQ